MSSIVDALYELKYNPFKYGEYIASFYSAISDVDNNLLLAQLVIPLCSHPVFACKLSNANIKSSIWSIFGDRTKLYDLQERIDEFQNLTEQSIQYCLVNDWLSVEEDSLALSFSANPEIPLAIQKNAEKLGRIFSGHSVVEIYEHLGVKPR
ncbi:hypothetical protein SAMN05216419_102917 [Nitrosomonas cryotolerans]|uniref:Uncharacterized protein n=1 Tax=Nitrosomonas cryotolerans ATCC 49181 TaxID=1131553 RepID=A0A1N6JJA2_9PROT|nr:three component ABC system middle component [Nitrosomonas cryotolerans]SFP89102.1 hypothetical protein SAMN05216419_102917 [Nitrosomonas cryotolerans]SIO44106.1 hypothetical protein SAMN02743940_2644 [Nitrosomonas cryotolerans ATCC 49181]